MTLLQEPITREELTDANYWRWTLTLSNVTL